MRNIYYIFVIFSSFLTVSCAPKLQVWYLKAEDIQRQPIAIEKNKSTYATQSNCFDVLTYTPDTAHLSHTPMKYVRVNFHWMNTRDSSRNYNGQEAINFTRDLLVAINKDLETNQRMWLPRGNETQVLPTRYRFVLAPVANIANDKGIYFHYDEELSPYVHKGKNANLHKREPINKYGIQLDSVLNIFIMPHHPDSVKSKTYGAYGVGVSLGDVVKAAGMFENKGAAGNYRGIFNHEIGHIFGLYHAWYGDDCADTPDHLNNCWTWTPEPPCDTTASNNLMDYNAYQNAWSPCQIGKIHYAMAQEGTLARRFLQPNWCQLHEDRNIIIRDSVEWRGAKDLEGNLTIVTGGVLKISCRVSLPANAKITLEPGATLILDNCRLHNACGDRWQGIEIQEFAKQKGKVIFIGEPKLENVMNIIAAEDVTSHMK